MDRTSARVFDVPALRRVFDDSATNVRARILTMYLLLGGANIGAWVLALAAFHTRPALVATAVLAYTFGLRHAVDADHISAIDNVTRKLMQENKRPVAVGFYFSLGHSTIVVALSVAIALAATAIQRTFPTMESVGGLIGTSISALFLYLIAAINLVVLFEVIRTFRAVRAGGSYDQETLDDFLMQRGLIGRCCRPLLRLIGRSWQMYPLGLLFGLGFDTATEVGLLGIAAMEASKGLPILTILIFPLLFTAGMSLVDTTDGILMLGAYGWAFVSPIRKLYYNMNITLVSVLVALLVGTIEALSVLNAQFGFTGPVWRAVSRLSNNFGLLGFVIVGLFAASWGVSVVVYKSRRLEATWPRPDTLSRNRDG
ncbi:MAG TPA: HoxN/HupN/NixA family nickel/cobalt transporter [Candidatus Acidoferrales bacterium]|nr:HoxN/HupN/NixA family nickel/cobalt transporter [Candidatus Acidoferrales bacterium]